MESAGGERGEARRCSLLSAVVGDSLDSLCCGGGPSDLGGAGPEPGAGDVEGVEGPGPETRRPPPPAVKVWYQAITTPDKQILAQPHA